MSKFYFTRHGEAEHNVVIARGREQNDMEEIARGRAILDPELTELGQTQARSLGQELREQRFAVIVTSPLRRARQTTDLIVEELKTKPRIVVTALHTESGMPIEGDDVAGQNCQRGGPVDDCADWITDDGTSYYHPLPVDARIPLFKEFLRQLEEPVLIVGHSGFYKELFGSSIKMKNCEVVSRATI